MKKTPPIASIHKTSSASVLKATKKDWNQWVQLLDDVGAIQWPRKELVAYLAKKHKLSPWWQQIVTSCYEIHKGKKIPGRNSKGEYQMTTDKTVAVSATKLWKFILSPEGLETWLEPLSPVQLKIGAEFEVNGGVFGEVRTMLAPRRIRLKWTDPEMEKATTVQVNLVPRPKNKCILIFQHEKLPNARVKESMRAYWKERLDRVIQNFTNPAKGSLPSRDD